MMTDFLVADLMFFEFIKSVIIVICCCYKFFESVKTVREKKPPRGNLCAITDFVFFFWNRHTDVTSRLFFSSHNSQRNDASTDALPFQLRLCS